MILILGLCLGLATVALLYAISLGFEIEVSFGEVLLWLGAGAAAAAFFHYWLGEKAAALFDGRSARKKTAEAWVLLRQKQYEAAEAVFRRCLDESPEDADALRGLAEIALRRGRAGEYVSLVARILSRPDALRRCERVTLCHRAADVCLLQLEDRKRAVELLARIELDYPGTTDAVRARRRIESILDRNNDNDP